MNRAANEPTDLDDRDLRNRAVAAARGDSPFDLLIQGGQIFDAVTGELRAADIGLIGPMIASVHIQGSRTDAAESIDAAGQIVTPGLIDTHMHIESSMVTPAVYAEAVLPRGVTTIIWDPHEFANVHGMAGVQWALDAVAELPLRVIVLAPSCVPSAPGMERAGAAFGGAELTKMLGKAGIGGVAEVMNMRGVVHRREPMTSIVQAGLASGKLVCGHARGLTGGHLNAFMAAGITSDHELTSGQDLLAKLRAGLTIELRGSHDHLLPEFVQVLNELGHLPPTVTLCTDDVFPDELASRGGLDDVVRRLIAYGMPQAWALKAATYHAALRLQRQDLGLIAPGRRADLAIFANLRGMAASTVIANGRSVTKAGKLSAPVTHHTIDAWLHSVHCPSFNTDDFRIKSAGKRVRVATIDQPRFTRWGETATDVIDGFVVPPTKATLIAVIHRHAQADAVPRIGYLRQWGDWTGAFATTVSHDSHNLTVFGGNEADMAVAANALIASGGGMVAVKNGQILALIALPVSGLVASASIDDVARQFLAVRDAMDEIISWQPPYLVFKALVGATLACNTGPHQTDLGIADIDRQSPLTTPVLEIIA